MLFVSKEDIINKDVAIAVFTLIMKLLANKYLNIYEHSTTTKTGVERIDQVKRLVEFAGYITLAGNQQ